MLRPESALLLAGVALLLTSAASPATVSPTAGAVPAAENPAWLGVYIQELTIPLAKALGAEDRQGVLVSDVAEQSPAAEAGMEAEDLILSVDGKPVPHTTALIDAIRSKEPGEKISIVALRSGQEISLEAALAEQPLSWARPRPHRPDFERRLLDGKHPSNIVLPQRFRLGVRVAPLEKGLARYFESQPGKGVLVLHVMLASPAADAGIEPGDVILEINDAQVASPGDLRQALREAEDQHVRLVVLRDGEREQLEAQIEFDVSLHESWKKPRALRGELRKQRAEDEFRRHLRTFRERAREAPVIAREELRHLREELHELREKLRELEAKIRSELDD
jgi:C-terminal processing protease CtpA/Prc